MPAQPTIAHDDANVGDDEFDGSDVEDSAVVLAAATTEQPSSTGPERTGSAWGGPGSEEDEIWDSPSLHTGSGWVHGDYTATKFIFAAAYNAARYGGPPVRRLNCSWHRPDDHDVQPLGHNPRGDIAPREVHAALSRMLAEAGESSALVQKLAHGVLDKTWLLHSRSNRLEKAVASSFDFLPESARVVLVDLIRRRPLTDIRLVAATVDPREKPVYGETLDSAGTSRWREVFIPRATHPDFDSDPAGITGSSPEAGGVMSSAGLPFLPLSPSDEERQARRWADRRTRRLARAAQLAADRANQAQVALEELLAKQARAETLQEILLRGVEAQRGPLPLTEPQHARAWYEHRPLREASAEEPPAMP